MENKEEKALSNILENNKQESKIVDKRRIFRETYTFTITKIDFKCKNIFVPYYVCGETIFILN